ncbi:TMEM175 family protein [Sphingomonas oleivorans]|uniref:TMEM175 family protein n=1 Tax=Sphingomonas oleivorans TaxID=1735121 RepID=UPI001FAF297F|nr:TMEM175 family protein [Sphingomonas oleivorans]
MLLNLRVPDGFGFSALRESAPLLIAYILSYVNVGLYWNNHRHFFQAPSRIARRACLPRPAADKTAMRCAGTEKGRPSGRPSFISE